MLSRTGVAPPPPAVRRLLSIPLPPLLSASTRLTEGRRGGTAVGRLTPWVSLKVEPASGKRTLERYKARCNLDHMATFCPPSVTVANRPLPRSATEPFSSDRGASVVVSLSIGRISCPQWLCQSNVGGDMITSRSSPPSLSTASRRAARPTKPAKPSQAHLGYSQGREETSDPD